MDLKVDGNPGQGNSFEENTYQHVDELYNHPTVYKQPAPTRMDSYFRSLLEEIEHGVTADVFEDLQFYRTKKDGKKDVEEKLTDGGFKPSRIREARHYKEMYRKVAERYDCYPSAQKIFLALFARIKHEFYTSIFPLIEQQTDLTIVMQQLRHKIVMPIMNMLEHNGRYDLYLNFTEDHIYGMIYYLTGLCHLDWVDYDLQPAATQP